MGRECSTYWRQKKAAYKILVGKHEGIIPLGTPRRKWEDYYKMDLQEVEWRHGLDWYGLGFGQVAGLMNVVMNIRVQYKAGNFLTS